jgi:16S rRNA (uracil1498-N3)-methyltransferase
MRAKPDFRSAALITGPEGGFSSEEAMQAKEAGIPLVTLGKRILRCETAPLCALSALMYETGNLD